MMCSKPSNEFLKFRGYMFTLGKFLCKFHFSSEYIDVHYNLYLLKLSYIAVFNFSNVGYAMCLSR